MRALVALALAALAALAAPALAQDPIARFYRGKTLTIIAGSSAGGGVDVYARLVARHLAKHVPGNPAVIVQNSPGAGSLSAARSLYATAPKDGSQIGIVLAGALFEPLMLGEDTKSFDPTRFNYLGDANVDTTVCLVRRDAPVRRFAEIFDKELVVGGTGPGSSLVDYPIVERNLLGAKIKLIAGYKGSNEISLAMQQNEVQGVCGLLWSSAKQQYPDILKPDGWVRVLVQEDTQASPEVARLEVPLIVDFARSPEQRRALEVYLAQGAISRPFLAPPGVPPERVAALRAAFMATLADADLAADAARQRSDVHPNSGAAVQAIVARLYATPPDLMKVIRKAAEPKP